MGMITGFKDSTDTDLGNKLLSKSYLIEKYPYLLDNFKFAGLWLWGNNTYGQLGTNSVINRSSPVQGGIGWKLVNCGSYHSMAIKTDGTLWAWGHNRDGQLGNNSTIHRSSPVQVFGGDTNWKSVTGGGWHTLAIKNNGTLWGWGANWGGQIGDTSIVNKSTPAQIGTGNNWDLIDGGWDFSSAIKTDNSLWLWGSNSYGQLGNNSTTNRSSPVQVSAGSTWESTVNGSHHSMAIRTDGTLWGWGRNDYGQLGNNSTTHRSSPVQVGGGMNWRSISAGAFYTIAIQTDGTLWGWGANYNGQLGDGSKIHRSSPVQVSGGGTNWRLIVSGWHYSAAIKSDGTLWLWGRNDDGELCQNDNQTGNKSSPVQIPVGGTNWKSIRSGGYYCLAIRDEYEDLI